MADGLGLGLEGCGSALYGAGRGTPLSSPLQVLCTTALERPCFTVRRSGVRLSVEGRSPFT